MTIISSSRAQLDAHVEGRSTNGPEPSVDGPRVQTEFTAASLVLAAGFAGLAACLLADDTGGVTLMTLLGVAGLGLGTAFTGNTTVREFTGQ